MTDDMDTADVLDAAADEIRNHGWCKGVPYIGEASCLLGALSHAGELDEVTRARHAVCGLLGFEQWYPLGDWNDMVTRTADEVITVLMEAAARVRLGEIKP